MKSIADFDLNPASRVYGIANTPLFLIRKLQTDPTVKELADSVSGSQILSAIQAAISKEPDNPVEAVLPYALLVALWFKPEVDDLQQAAKLVAPSHTWFQFIANVLIEKFSPIQRQTIQAPSLVSNSTLNITSSTPTSRIILAR